MEAPDPDLLWRCGIIDGLLRRATENGGERDARLHVGGGVNKLPWSDPSETLSEMKKLVLS